VDERLNGDGVGLPLGINDPVLGWVLLSVFLLVWGLYSTSVRSISNNDDDAKTRRRRRRRRRRSVFRQAVRVGLQPLWNEALEQLSDSG